MAVIKQVVKFYRGKLVLVFFTLALFGMYKNQSKYLPEILHQHRSSKYFEDNELLCKISSPKYFAAESSSAVDTGFAKVNYSDTIVMVIVVCPPPKKTGPRDEAVVLLKSVVISAKLNKIKNIEIFIFLENVKRESHFLLGKLKEMGYPFNFVNLTLNFKSANDAVPENYRHKFIKGADNKKLLRCTNVRIFFPTALPEVDSILYLDTDVVVHGNLADLWSVWGFMNQKQLIGISTDYEEGSDRAIWFENAPFPPPRGLNAGILLMNLTKMRECDWQERLLELWKTYHETIPTFNDQHLINIILYYNNDLMYRLPCHFNFMEQHCNSDSPCKTASKCGMQLIHGAAERFDMIGPFRNYYLAYKELNFTELDLSSEKTLRLKLQLSYEHFHNISNKKKVNKKRLEENVQCHPVLNELI